MAPTAPVEARTGSSTTSTTPQIGSRSCASTTEATSTATADRWPEPGRDGTLVARLSNDDRTHRSQTSATDSRSPADRPVVYPIDWKRRRERLHCRGNRPPASAADGTLDRADVGLSIANSVQDRQCNRIRSHARLRAHSRTRRLAEGSRRDIPSGPPSARLGGSTSSNLGCNGAEQQGIPRDGGGVCAALESRDEDGSSGRLRPSALGGLRYLLLKATAGLPLRQAPC